MEAVRTSPTLAIPEILIELNVGGPQTVGVGSDVAEAVPELLVKVMVTVIVLLTSSSLTVYSFYCPPQHHLRLSIHRSKRKQ